MTKGQRPTEFNIASGQFSALAMFVSIIVFCTSADEEGCLCLPRSVTRYSAVQILVTNKDRLVGWPFEDVGRGKLRGAGLGDRIQSEGNPHWDSIQTMSRKATRMYYERLFDIQLKL